DFQHPSNNTLYGLYDKVLKHREVIEWRLWERKTFHLGRKGLLYDLTNTYLTERGYESTKAHHGRSKEKRNDCPLLTLALVLDEEEFAKSSRVLEGNVSEPETLQEFLEAFKKERGTQLSLLSKLPTVVVYAGVCTQENLDLILEQVFHYISVSRNKPQEIPQEDLTMIKQDKDCTLKAKRMDHEGEVFLYCESTARARKEESMKAKFHQKHYEEGLSSIAKSLSKKRVMQRYEKVMERLGRLRERYPTISQYYQVEVEQGSGRTTGMTWSIKREEEMRLRFSGTYYLQGFNSKGIVNRWGAIKSRLATQVWITASITNGKGARIHLQHTIDPRSLSIMRSTSLWGYCQAVETQTTGDLKDVELIDYCIMTFTGSIRCLCCDCW
ncbi:MAG: hypothetical protein SVY53_00530, partial [Chloroflexota bacterium]|nr:hypothetical protein [Chloroflexota bacterium]